MHAIITKQIIRHFSNTKNFTLRTLETLNKETVKKNHIGSYTIAWHDTICIFSGKKNGKNRHILLAR